MPTRTSKYGRQPARTHAAEPVYDVPPVSPHASDADSELARPRTPFGMRSANALLSVAARRVWPIEPEAFKRSARRITRLYDFGEGEPLDEPLAVLCGSLNEEVNLHPIGRAGLSRLILSSLVTRLRLHELARRRPEIFAAPINPPVVIVGLPRSGTTFLHRLLARDRAAWHTAPLWKLWDPVPADGAANPAAHRRQMAAGRRNVAMATWMAPRLVAIHDLDHAAPDEEIVTMAAAFSSLIYEWSVGVPAYASWYRSTDHTAGYRYLRRVLQAMQWTRPAAGRWLLKAPQHLEQLTPLLRVFPDATIVHTHREPVPAVVSLAHFVTYAARLYVDRPDPCGTGSRCADLVERLLRAADRDRDQADGRYVDVGFDQLCKDPMTAVERVYAAAGQELTAQARAHLVGGLPQNLRGEQRTHRHVAEDFGLDADELRERFRFYRP
jgi:hypothetical protein